MNDIKQFVEDQGVEVLIFENPSYDTAFVGVDYVGERAIYDYDLMVEYLMRTDDMKEEEATEFIDYNSSFSGEGYPIIMKVMRGEYTQ